MSVSELKFEKSCGAVIYRKRAGLNEFLLIKSKDDDYWGFPKGHMEENEDEIETALREVYEETGLNIEIVHGFRVETEFFILTDILKKVVFFIGIPNDVPVKIDTDEVDDYRWMTFEAALKTFTFESDKYILRSAYGHIQKIK